MRLHKLRANGAEPHYFECGDSEPLMLVHGGSGDYQSWQRQLPRFSQEFRVISYSWRYSYSNMNRLMSAHSAYFDANDLAAVVQKLTPRARTDDRPLIEDYRRTVCSWPISAPFAIQPIPSRAVFDVNCWMTRAAGAVMAYTLNLHSIT